MKRISNLSQKCKVMTINTSLIRSSSLCVNWEEPTLNPNSTRSWRLSAACVQVIAMILASFTSRYLERSSPLLSSSKARNSFQGRDDKRWVSGVNHCTPKSYINRCVVGETNQERKNLGELDNYHSIIYLWCSFDCGFVFHFITMGLWGEMLIVTGR